MIVLGGKFLSPNSQVFQKCWFEDSGVPSYSLLILGIFQPGFLERLGIWGV
jgi:hypothetical protein